MKTEPHESFGQDGSRSASFTAPRDTVMPFAAPATLWLETVNSVFKWYGAIVRLAFDSGRMYRHSEAPMTSAASTSKPDESPFDAQPDSPPGRLVQLRPGPG